MSASSPSQDRKTLPDEQQSELSAVLASNAFRKSVTLRRMLQFLCERSTEGESSLKEYDIATQVLGRREDFDPKLDASVRVNLHSLRKKLSQFYEDEGATHRVRIVLPTGAVLSAVPPG